MSELYKEQMDDSDYPIINNFVELFDEISYSWDYRHGIDKDENGCFHINKLSIGKNWAQYKMNLYKLAPGVYEKLEKFYELLKE